MLRDGSIRRDGGRHAKAAYVSQSPVMPYEAPTTNPTINSVREQQGKQPLPKRLTDILEAGLTGVLDRMYADKPTVAENLALASAWVQAIQRAQDAGDRATGRKVFGMGPLKFAIANGVDLHRRHPSANAELVRLCKRAIEQALLQAKGAQP